MTSTIPMMPPRGDRQERPSMSPEMKRSIGVACSLYPARTVFAMIRSKTGFRNLKPSHLVVTTLLMGGFGYFIGGGTNTAPESGFLAPAARAVRPAQPRIPEGLDAPLPGNWNVMPFGQRNAWVTQHRLTPQQMQEQARRSREEQQRLQAQEQAEAASAARRAKFMALLKEWPIYCYAFAFLVWGLIQRRLQWRRLLEGEKWHTFSRGVPYLTKFLPAGFPETYILRFIEPLGVMFAGALIAIFWTRSLGLWLMLSACAVYFTEQFFYEMQLERELDQLDLLIDGESKLESYRHWKKVVAPPKPGQIVTAPSIENNGGVLSTAAVIPQDLLRKRRERRERRGEAVDEEIAEEEDKLEKERAAPFKRPVL